MRAMGQKDIMNAITHEWAEDLGASRVLWHNCYNWH